MRIALHRRAPSAPGSASSTPDHFSPTCFSVAASAPPTTYGSSLLLYPECGPRRKRPRPRRNASPALGTRTNLPPIQRGSSPLAASWAEPRSLSSQQGCAGQALPPPWGHASSPSLVGTCVGGEAVVVGRRVSHGGCAPPQGATRSERIERGLAVVLHDPLDGASLNPPSVAAAVLFMPRREGIAPSADAVASARHAAANLDPNTRGRPRSARAPRAPCGRAGGVRGLPASRPFARAAREDSARRLPRGSTAAAPRGSPPVIAAAGPALRLAVAVRGRGHADGGRG